jgi:hypothetical protein
MYRVELHEEDWETILDSLNNSASLLTDIVGSRTAHLQAGVLNRLAEEIKFKLEDQGAFDDNDV